MAGTSALTDRSATRPIAIIGAGLAGLTLALGLQAAGRAVQVFDKSRGPGGRCATRRSAAGPFDHGAPLIQAHTADFAQALRGWAAQGWVAPVPETLGGPAWIGVPTMNAWLQQLSQGLVIHTERQVSALQHGGDGWRLKCLEGSPIDEVFEAVLVALPAEQAAALLETAAAEAQPTPAAAALRQVASQACWTVMAAWPADLPLTFSHWQGTDPLAALDQAWRQDVRPGRLPQPGAASRWVLHATPEWSAQNLDARPEDVAQRLVDALAAVTGVRLAHPSFTAAHRWRFARVSTALAPACAWDDTLKLGACGDAWHALSLNAESASGSALQGLERAWLSARALVAELLGPGVRPPP